jgi:hypothetical protein
MNISTFVSEGTANRLEEQHNNCESLFIIFLSAQQHKWFIHLSHSLQHVSAGDYGHYRVQLQSAAA